MATKSRNIIRYWTNREMVLLEHLVSVGASQDTMARQLGRSWWSIRSRVLRLRAAEKKAALNPVAHHERAYRCETDDNKHLQGVLAASPGGFPFYDIKAQYRVAA